jgi:hypothetical protein
MTAAEAASRTDRPRLDTAPTEPYDLSFRPRRFLMLVEVTCRCGWRCRGTEDEVIEQVRSHSRSAHGVETTPDEVRAIWRPVEGKTAGGP